MSGRILQLWVERLALDPAAWTAAHALQLLLGADAPQRVGRADLWELSVDGTESSPPDADDVATRFDEWMRASNLFMNPGRDKALVLTGTPADDGPSIGHVVVIDRGLAGSRAHGITLGHALGGRWSARRGTVWTLEWPAERAEEIPALLPQAAWAKRRHGGLLVNQQSQDARLYVGAWECPALPPDEEEPKARKAGGSDGGVA